MEPFRQPSCTPLCGLEAVVRTISRSGSNLFSQVSEPELGKVHRSSSASQNSEPLHGRHWQEPEQPSQWEWQQHDAGSVQQQSVVRGDIDAHRAHQATDLAQQEHEQPSRWEWQQNDAGSLQQQDAVLGDVDASYTYQVTDATLQQREAGYTFQASDATQKEKPECDWEDNADLELPSWCTPRCMMMCCCGTLVLFIILVILLGTSAKKVHRYHIGLVRNSITGRVALEQGVYTSGVHFVGFWNGFLLFPCTIRTIQFSTGSSTEAPESGVQQIAPLTLRSSDSLPMQLEISVQYRLLKNQLPQLFQRAMTATLQENIFISELRAAFIQVMSLHEARDCWTRRSTLLANFLRACQESLAKVHAECWNLQIYRITMGTKYEQALVATQVQKQRENLEEARRSAAQIRAETEVLLEAIRANISVFETKSATERYQLIASTQSVVDARKVDAEARVTSTVREVLRLSSSMGLSGNQLKFYQQALMLSSNLTGTRFLAGLSAPPSHVMARSK